MNKKERAAFEAAREAALDQGRDHFRKEPEAMLCEVARTASASLADKECQMAFLEGFKQARAQREAFMMESDYE